MQGLTTDVAIGSITVGHRVEFANILAGYDQTLNAVNPDAQIGTVNVGGNWVASNLVAGVKNLGADNADGGGDDNINYGDIHDALITGGSPDNANIISRIAKITVNGQVFGTPNSINANDHFGFVAEQIGLLPLPLHIGGWNVAINLGPHSVGDNHSLGASNDMYVHEK